MWRRDFVSLVGGATVSWPLAPRAQQRAMPVIGFLSSRSPRESEPAVAAFGRGIGEAGYVEGQNVAIDFRWEEGRYDRLPALATELVKMKPAVMVAAGGEPSAFAAKAATKTVPIIFVIGDDPVRLELIATFNRPGGNATGVSLMASALGSKRLELICELVPDAGTVGLLVNPNNVTAEAHTQDVQAAAKALGRKLLVLRAGSESEFEASFATLKQSGGGALVVENDPFFDSQREKLVALAAGHAIPTIYHVHEYPAAGGLLSYGPSLVDAYHLLGVQTGRVLKGEKPADMPVQQPTKFELAINLKIARALGLTVPPSILARADEVIE